MGAGKRNREGYKQQENFKQSAVQLSDYSYNNMCSKIASKAVEVLITEKWQMLNNCATDLDLVIINSTHDALVIDLFSFKYFSCVCVMCV